MTNKRYWEVMKVEERGVGYTNRATLIRYQQVAKNKTDR